RPRTPAHDQGHSPSQPDTPASPPRRRAHAPAAREYEVEVRVGTRVLGTGSGTSKKAAEQVAAEHALEHYP
ncbi:MAG: putative dsRNA-binding protein, partial [Myxococcota bacterium]